MWKLLSLVLLLTLPGTLHATSTQTPGANSAEWKRFRVINEHFSVMLPQLPVARERGQSGTIPIGIPPFGLPVRRVARSFAAYADGVVYLAIYFSNPKHDEPLEFFLEKELSRDELRNVEIITRAETSENNLKVVRIQFKKYDFGKTFNYPGVLKLFDTENEIFALLAIGKDESDASVGRFLQSLEITGKPSGIDIGEGASNVGDANEPANLIAAPDTVSRKAMIILKPEPHYTEAARRKQLRGAVVLKAVLAASERLRTSKLCQACRTLFKVQSKSLEKSASYLQ